MAKFSVILAALWFISTSLNESYARAADASDIHNKFIQSLWDLAGHDSILSESDILNTLEMNPKLYSRYASDHAADVSYSTSADVLIRNLALRDVSDPLCCQPAQSVVLSFRDEECISLQTMLVSPFGKEHRFTQTISHVLGGSGGIPDGAYDNHDLYYRVSGEWETFIEIRWPKRQCVSQLEVKHQYCGNDCLK